MFKNFFKSKKNYEPLNYEQRKYFENNILCLNNDFTELSLEQRKIFTPTELDFPIEWNGSEENAFDVLKIVSANMQLNPNEIKIDFYEEGLKEINAGSSVIFLENDDENTLTAGLYYGKNKDGYYEISINTDTLKNPTALIATVAHELCHIKLLGEKNTEENDEYLTDLAVVFFGFGIFSANASFQFFQQYDRWGYNGVGYLKYDEWAYSLALFAFLRYEDNPEWANFLNPTIKKEFKRCLAYMLENESEIFKFEDKTI